jgi:hypothetical protein
VFRLSNHDVLIAVLSLLIYKQRWGYVAPFLFIFSTVVVLCKFSSLHYICCPFSHILCNCAQSWILIVTTTFPSNRDNQALAAIKANL